MSCGCGGNSSGASAGGPLLSGVLDPRFATDSGAAPSGAIDASLADAGGTFSSGGFWIVVVFIAVAAYVVDSARRKNE